MRWQVKAAALAVLSHAPGGRAMYTRIQAARAARADDADEMLDRALELLRLYREHTGHLPSGDCLELGTGWKPFVPILLRVAGARHVITLDANPWLSLATALATTRAVAERAERLSSELGTASTTIRDWLARAGGAATLDQWLTTTGIDYRPVPDSRRTGLDDDSIDAVFSSNVLEHVESSVLEGLHRETYRLLRPGGLAVHRFNPQDHFSSIDRRITGANFLKYSPEAWRWLGSGLSYHNRLRCVQHLDLIRSAGLRIAMSRTRSDARAAAAIESGALRVHPDFHGLTSVELSDAYMWVIAGRS